MKNENYYKFKALRLIGDIPEGSCMTNDGIDLTGWSEQDRKEFWNLVDKGENCGKLQKETINNGETN